MEVCIETDGSSLKVKNGIFLIESKEKKVEVSPINVRSFVVKANISITTSAVSLILNNDIELVFIDNYEKPYGRIINTEFSKSGYLRQTQYKVFNSNLGFDIAKAILMKKSLKQKEHAISIMKTSDSSEKGKIYDIFLTQLKNCNSGQIDELMGIEGNITKFYYSILSENLSGRFTFEKRSFMPAKDEFNACLNYLYGVLYRKVERALLNAGLDLNTGFLHSNKKKSLSLVFDFIEIFRHYAMSFNYSLFQSKEIRKSFFEYNNESVGLNKEGRNFLIAEFSDFLESTELYNNNHTKRIEVIKSEAFKFSDMILDLSNKNK